MSEITIKELKQKKIWLLWNYMSSKDGKVTKVPISAYGGATGTDDKYKDTWATYDEAYTAMQSCGASGVGFKVPEDVYFLDIDHRDMADPLLQKLFNRHNSYYWVIGRKPISMRTLTEKFAFFDQIGYLAMEFLDGKLVRKEAIKVIPMK